MGAVWRAEHVELGTPAAVKLLDPTIAGSSEALVRFKREAQAAATLRSPHVVQILDYGVDGGTPYIAMELLEGESLAARLRRVGRLSPAVTATILTHVARAVAKAHGMGIIHRDLKPDNVFLVPYEDGEMAKVLDFGIAKRTATGAASLGAPETRTGSLLGTPYYMSPEQASGRKEVDHRTDIWAMAVIAFECLTGRRPFDDETLGGLVLAICAEAPPVPSAVSQVPPGFDDWFSRGTAKEPGQRFQSAKELAAELGRVCGLEQRQGSLASKETAPLAPGGTEIIDQWIGERSGALAATPATQPAANATGAGQLESTATQAPPSALTLQSFMRKPRSGLLFGGAAAVLGLIAGGYSAFRAASTDAGTSAASSARAIDATAAPAESALPQPEAVSSAPVASSSSAPGPGATTRPKPAQQALAPSSKPTDPPRVRSAAPRTVQPVLPVVTAPSTAPPKPEQRSPGSARQRLESELGL
jgi:serine/threonine protein kinase